MIRAYSNTDKPRIIELLKQNTPDYFDVSETSDLITYLDHAVEDYFVYESDSEIIGAGGLNYFPSEKSARMSWDIIAPKYHGQGIGKQLVQYRLKHLSTKTNIEHIMVRTTQMAYRFYEKMGFELERIEKDFWAAGFDLYQMKMNNKT
ncbi:GNAT family acetyltransferase [Mangrovimonas yunxiaonensis]|uniref:GNAT family acetyltransferase n=1 Tax=Mangrovimonas yunxiaonensis TaxID=1197477 RepID=A0A084THH0_9FLAO|nr:GNAT family N-acetyltransferase [Mangrovimonas yunxiaonensis]KFB00156.1 GNAT family acetyltransferase [Mangrovimonas yunxiaonensis]GGH42236.1 hypothetical protein GCM10011364_13590 [Mangrovimonas yunxiaonensis]